MKSYKARDWSIPCQASLATSKWLWCPNSAKYDVIRIMPNVSFQYWGVTSKDIVTNIAVCGIHIKKHLVGRAKFRLIGANSGYTRYDIKPMNKYGEVEG